ncbi:type 1 glutamine amidotransferase domain-containing protein [Microbulbifer sp. GL-2]|uniref:type 1 glutamine amidotransferase domain-containing protein n=1 Tax=Microbulbifer sp. GL-2 TaxID=2591606 RepID=UPI001164C279|nr:type 1 glutamine amidotransferase domain-containing protein [Microbulbifer sp. GL-2]BBM02577.1 hypothetical protein GL2_26510 [Microbulbifer sp. GL-2]
MDLIKHEKYNHIAHHRFILCFWVGKISAAEKILIVASDLTDMGDPDKHDVRNNLWEYAPPYHIFVSHGYEVDFVSPSGGTIRFMMDPLGISSYTVNYEGFQERANHSLKPTEVRLENYVAVYVGGGYGTLFDVASNKQMLDVMAGIYDNGGIIGSCGHGGGAFANVKLENGQFFVQDKKFAGFPDSREKEKAWAMQVILLPFMVESELKRNGALTVDKGDVSDKYDIVLGERIVSSMFLPSAVLVAKEMIVLLDQDK